MKQRFWLIICIIILAAIILIAAAASNARPQGNVYGKVYTVTVNGDIGIQSLAIVNYNTASQWIVLPQQLPYSFNCTSNDQLSFTAQPKTGYRFNAWVPNSGIPYSVNPYVMKAIAPFSLMATFTPEELTQ